MAWTEQCKVAFTTTADALYYQQQGKKNKTKILKTLAEETDIPRETLRRWWKEANRVKNDPTEVSALNVKENEDDSGTAKPLCTECKKNPPENNRTLCGSCRHKKERQNKIKYIHSLCGQIKTMAKNIRNDGSTNPKWNNAVPKKEYKAFIDILIETIHLWQEVSK